MASATNATTPTNSLSSSGLKDGGGRQTGKHTGSVKMPERNRKESPVDQGRRAPTQRAWPGGTNSTHQRGSTPSQLNGSATSNKSSGFAKSTAQKDVGLSNKQSYERLQFFLGGIIGLSVTLTTKSGDKYEGLVAGSSMAANDSKLTMKMVKRTRTATSSANGHAAQEAAFVGTSPEHAISFDLKDMIDLSIPHFSLPETSKPANGAGAAFQTDADISASAGLGSERELQKWIPDGPETNDFSLESGSIGHWDQFAAHKTRFGDNSTYDENMYTTTINRSAPGYAERAEKAERVARSILTESSMHAHVREERGLAADSDEEDEEAKYSGVRRADKVLSPLSIGGQNKYTPPARRAPSGQPTVPGVPVDSAIISAQLSAPNMATSQPGTPLADKGDIVTGDVTSPAGGASTRQETTTAGSADAPAQASRTAKSSNSPQRKADNPTENIENKLLSHFHQFANTERQRYQERKRAQANQDRAAKINDLLRFAKTFKLKTPIPTDLVGILAKDPDKQEAIIERAQKEHEQANFVAPPPAPTTATTASSTSTTLGSTKLPAVPKFDASQIPSPIPDRATFNRSRGGLPLNSTRGQPVPQQSVAGVRNAPATGPRGSLQHERKGQLPAPIPIIDGRVPPTGPSADQSPQRSQIHTPTSATASKFNVRAMEFRPNVNAPAFNPSAASNPPSSPASMQRTSSISRAATPSMFFSGRKPKPLVERAKISASFNPVRHMREEIQRQTSERTDTPVKDYAHNGGIPNAYHTAPIWTVRAENKDKSYKAAFDKFPTGISPASGRIHSGQHTSFHGTHMANGMPHVSAPQHGMQVNLPAYGHQHFDEHRLHGPGSSPQVYPSPGMAVRQMSGFGSPMGHQPPATYGQPSYYAGTAGQMPMPVRQYPTTPNMMHAQPGQVTAPMMMQQPSSGPYMSVPQQYGQMPMYSPGAGHVYPQQNGYPSPGRMAPMMMHQSSQQSHHSGQQMMFSVPGQPGPMGYAQPGQMNVMRGYGGNPGPYASSPHQAPHMQQRAMSSGYGQKSLAQQMPQGSGPPAGTPQAPSSFSQTEGSSEDAK